MRVRSAKQSPLGSRLVQHNRQSKTLVVSREMGRETRWEEQSVRLRQIVSCMLILLSTLLCSCTAASQGQASLNPTEQALASQLFNNRSQWESFANSDGSFYCLYLSAVKTGDGATVDCYYSDKAQVPTTSGAAFVYVRATVFYVTADGFTIGSDIDPSGAGRLVPGQPISSEMYYSVIDDDATKQAIINRLFRGIT